ncbi:MAG: hypothetical protein C0169_04875 [Thermodesulfobacterium geofontis]|uniref:Uncharacterized protein n=1 Tax=Thermodesulfobacterium geofontis TaxID=1295609 RepID=A0A2N7QC09_9BACT|nr:MAG: hypothetical protein C0169_04875 [Thermodesulfobacterium geofontis]
MFSREYKNTSLIKLTKAGWLYIGITLALGAASVNTGNNLLYLITSAFLSFMLLAGVFGKRNIEALDMEVTFPEEIYANRSAFIKIKIINRKKFFPAFLIKVLIKDFNLSCLFPYFERETSAILKIKPEKRGFQNLKEIYIISVFPFNFFVRWKRINKTFSFIVFPEPKKCAFSFYQNKKNKGEILIDKLGWEGDILSIKDYTEGTPVKYIHWKATAKTDKLKVKELSDHTTQPIIIDFEKISILEKELKLSCITYLILEMMKKGIPVGLKIKEKIYKPNLSYKHKITLLTELALYE